MRIITLMLTMCVSLGSTLVSQETPEQAIKKFFVSLEKKEVGKGLDIFYSANKWIKRQTDQLDNLKSSLEKLNEDYMGKYYGSDLIVKKSLNDRLLIYCYMVRYERQPLRFTFKFYRPDDKWVAWSISYDGNLDDELTEAAKIYRQTLE